MRALDLFSAAAGGWTLGLHRTGFVTVAACEIVEWRRILYAENNPNVRLYEDVRSLTAARLVSDLGYLPDIIVGSPPCQDISVANTRGHGIDGERSRLYLEAVRLVGDCRPRWFAFENSAHLRTRGADRLLDALAALGYACEPCVVGAGDLGANHVHFTGSTRIGRIIAETAGRHLKRTVLELGGKAPCIILADADLDRAVSAAAFGSFANSGQGCLSTERIIVDRSIAEEFCQRLAAVAKTIVYGDPRDPATGLGPVIDAAAIKRLSEMVEDAVAAGAKLLAGGKADGPCFAPTVLSGVTAAMRAYQEESFGPMATVVIVDGPEEALRVANDNAYGLSSSIFSRDVTLALDIAKRLDAGMSHINGTTLDDEAQIPFGGVKDSGYGRSGGAAGLEELTELQWITIEGVEAPRYPITE